MKKITLILLLFLSVGTFAQQINWKTIEEAEIEKIKGCKVLVINCLREEYHSTHFNLEEALHFISLVQPNKTYFTHISHVFGFHEEIQAKLPDNVFVAYDNLTINHQ